MAWSARSAQFVDRHIHDLVHGRLGLRPDIGDPAQTVAELPIGFGAVNDSNRPEGRLTLLYVRIEVFADESYDQVKLNKIVMLLYCPKTTPESHIDAAKIRLAYAPVEH